MIMAFEEDSARSRIVQELTARQRSVMERIDRRVPIKVIASELGVSETRINQHIRALKDIFEAGSLNELVEKYRARQRAQANAPETTPYRKPEYSKKQLPEETALADYRLRDSASDQSAGSYAPVMSLMASGADQSEPNIVPGVLDGENAVIFRLAAIVGIAFGILAAVVLSVTAALALSEAMEGVAAVPEENL
ncbi:LuxR C-terminal-related transcriptional regulator [Erythrobacter sp. HA6-11]